MSLTDRTVLITGASSGIGAAATRAVCAAGGKVVLFARSADKLAAVAGELGDAAVWLAGDVTRQDDIDAAAGLACERFGGIDAVLVNAGLFTTGPLASADPDGWARMIDVNLTGAARTVHAVLPHMLGRGAGDIVFTGSIAGRAVYPNGAVYAATKHGIYALAQGLRMEVHTAGIRVGVISPGYVANEIWGITDPAEIHRRTDAGTALESDDIAAAIVHTLSLPAHVNFADVLVLPSRADVPAM